MGLFLWARYPCRRPHSPYAHALGGDTRRLFVGGAAECRFTVTLLGRNGLRRRTHTRSITQIHSLGCVALQSHLLGHNSVRRSIRSIHRNFHGRLASDEGHPAGNLELGGGGVKDLGFRLESVGFRV